ncbi:hypothetical protein BJX68DRAFT_231084 [Aspergillus pseudodeflectus]|uniref:Uncharacterized protein n=1 Tax=Aspergillus pseudodeflectus TaxID=176178 RepID=A0ABR4KTW5_9EURO
MVKISQYFQVRCQFLRATRLANLLLPIYRKIWTVALLTLCAFLPLITGDGWTGSRWRGSDLEIPQFVSPKEGL